METYFRSFDWRVLNQGTVDDAAELFEQELSRQMHMHIPRISKPMEKSTLPWLTDKCVEAIQAKHMAEGTDQYDQIAMHTSAILHQERSAYTAQLKKKMEKLPKCSKQWWTLNKRLLNKQASLSLFPPLKNADGVWCKTPKTKADAFVTCWTAKCILPPEQYEHFFCSVADACQLSSPSGAGQ